MLCVSVHWVGLIAFHVLLRPSSLILSTLDPVGLEGHLDSKTQAWARNGAKSLDVDRICETIQSDT